MLEYYPDRTYSVNVGIGSFKTKAKSSHAKKIRMMTLDLPALKNGNSFIKTLLSFRWSKYGGSIVLIRQKETSDESYNLAFNLKQEMQEELKVNNKFVNDFEAFKIWINQKIPILERNGFYKIKG